MKLTVVTDNGSTIVFNNVIDIKYNGCGEVKEISFYTLTPEGSIKWNWEYLIDIRSIVLTAQ